ncbi:uncharacterized protein LOC144754217 isoform X2 [Lissotriton helveticus]
MEKKITTIENANIIKVSNQITSLNALIMEVEKMCEASAWDILKDVRSILSRCNNVKNPCPGMVKSYKVSPPAWTESPPSSLTRPGDPPNKPVGIHQNSVP